MPLYEYACHGCGRQFELLVRGDTVPACPDCGGLDLRKLLSTFAVSVGTGSPGIGYNQAPCGTCGSPDGPGSCRLDD